MDSTGGVSNIMAVLSLGSIQPGKVSLFNVSATTTQTNVLFTYKYKQGKLPAGLTVQPNGEVEGIVGDKYFKIDGGITTLDTVDSVETTTIDREYTFTVTATGSDYALTTSNQQFKIKITPTYTDDYTSIYAEAGLNTIQRNKFISQYSNNNIFDNQMLYRPEDPHFGVSKQLRMLLISGIKTTHLKEYINEMLTNFSNKTLYLGDLTTAKAKNSSGTTIYEVLYYPIVDPIDGISASQNIGSEASIPFRVTDVVKTNTSLYTSDLTHYQNVYPNSLKNMRERLDDVGQVTGEFLPMWMRSTQDSGNALGWIPAVPIAYCKPEQSAQIKYNLQTNGLNIKEFPFQFKDLTIDNHLGTTFDKAIQTVTRTGDGTNKKFTITTYTKDDSTTGTHTISSSKCVRITVDGTFQDPSLYTLGLTADSSNTSDSTTESADADGGRSTTIVFTTAPISSSSIIITRKHNVGFDTRNYTSFDATERTQTDTSNGGDGSTIVFTIFFAPKVTPTVKISGNTITGFSYSGNTITLDPPLPPGSLLSADIFTVTTDDTTETADATGEAIIVIGIPAKTTFDNQGTTFSDNGITFDIGRNSTRTLSIPRKDLIHDQGFAIQSV
jgi:hypothetical protein